MLLMRTSEISTLFYASLSEKYILSQSMKPYILLDLSASRIGPVLRPASKRRFCQSQINHARKPRRGSPYNSNAKTAKSTHSVRAHAFVFSMHGLISLVPNLKVSRRPRCIGVAHIWPPSVNQFDCNGSPRYPVSCGKTFFFQKKTMLDPTM